MAENCRAEVVKISYNKESKRAEYVLRYESDGRSIEVTSEESAGSICEVGDVVRVTVENGKIIGTDIARATKRRSALMLVTLVVIIAVCALLISLFCLL